MKKFIKMFVLMLVVIPGLVFAKNPGDYDFYKKERLNISYIFGLDSVSDGYIVSGVASDNTTARRTVYKTDLNGNPIKVYQDDITGFFVKAFEHNNKTYVLSIDLTDAKIHVTVFDKDFNVLSNIDTGCEAGGIALMGEFHDDLLYITTVTDDGTVYGVKDSAGNRNDYLIYNTANDTMTTITYTSSTPSLVTRLKDAKTKHGGIAVNYAENDKYFITVGVVANLDKGGHLMTFYNKSKSDFDEPIGNPDSYIMYSDVELIDNYAYVVAVNDSNIGAFNLDTKEEVMIDTKSHLVGNTISIRGIASEKNGFAVAVQDCVGSDSSTCQFDLLVYKDKETLAKLNGENNKSSDEVKDKKVDKNPDTGVFTYITEVAIIIAACVAGFFLVQKTRKFKNM